MRKKIKDIKIPLPHLDDQIRIATLLSRVEALITTRKENLGLLDEFLQSTFLEMFGDPVRNERGWVVRKVGEISDSRLGKMRDKKNITGRHLRVYLGNSNVQWFSFNVDNLLEMDFTKNKVDPFVKTLFLKNKVEQRCLFQLPQPQRWSPVGDASPSSPPSGSVDLSVGVKAARNEHSSWP
ncbi:MAG: hypothetical protein GY799_26110 [Desulfobulbaceae bacterium]|nr:hypothetical protein [Desulfobulbaceae bacterium]